MAMLEQVIFPEEEDISRPPTQPPTRIIITLSSMAAAAAILPLGVPPMGGGGASGVRDVSGKEVILGGTFGSKASWFKCPFLLLP